MIIYIYIYIYMQHVFGNILQCGSDSLLEFFNVSRKRGDIDESFHISPEEKKSHGVRSGDRGGHFSRTQAENHCRIGECYQRHAAACLAWVWLPTWQRNTKDLILKMWNYQRRLSYLCSNDTKSISRKEKRAEGIITFDCWDAL